MNLDHKCFKERSPKVKGILLKNKGVLVFTGDTICTSCESANEVEVYIEPSYCPYCGERLI